MAALWRMNHELELLSKRMLRSLGLTGPQRLVLKLVAGHAGICAGDVAAGVHLDPSTMTGILGRLSRRGLLARTRDKEDARRVLLDLTPAGLALAETQRGTVEAAIIASLARVEPGERDVVLRGLRALGDAVTDERRFLEDLRPEPPAR